MPKRQINTPTVGTEIRQVHVKARTSNTGPKQNAVRRPTAPQIGRVSRVRRHATEKSCMANIPFLPDRATLKRSHARRNRPPSRSRRALKTGVSIASARWSCRAGRICGGRPESVADSHAAFRTSRTAQAVIGLPQPQRLPAAVRAGAVPVTLSGIAPFPARRTGAAHFQCPEPLTGFLP